LDGERPFFDKMEDAAKETLTEAKDGGQCSTDRHVRRRRCACSVLYARNDGKEKDEEAASKKKNPLKGRGKSDCCRGVRVERRWWQIEAE